MAGISLLQVEGQVTQNEKCCVRRQIQTHGHILVSLMLHRKPAWLNANMLLKIFKMHDNDEWLSQHEY